MNAGAAVEPVEVLVADDERSIADSLQMYLEGIGYRVVTARDGREALELFTARRMPLVLIDDLDKPDLKTAQEIFHGVADLTGDSLALAREAAKTNANVIVLCGVHFMAETAKLLNPDKTVLLPDVQAGWTFPLCAPAGGRCGGAGNLPHGHFLSLRFLRRRAFRPFSAVSGEPRRERKEQLHSLTL